MTANGFGDAFDRHIGPDPADLDADVLLLDADPTLPVWQPEPVEDASCYATEAEYYDLTDLLESPCLLTIADDLGSYAQLVHANPLVELTSDAATELRARVTGRAA